MKLSQLLNAREGLLRRAGLANLAFAYQTLTDFAHRVARARLSGSVNLKSADPDDERYNASLTALDFNQSLIEEHFTDEDLTNLADAIAYLAAKDDVDITRRIEDFAENFTGPLRSVLEQAGIVVDGEPQEIKANLPKDIV